MCCPVLSSKTAQSDKLCFSTRMNDGKSSSRGVYTRVATAVNWIHGIICQISRAPPTWCQRSKRKKSSSKKKNKKSKHNNFRGLKSDGSGLKESHIALDSADAERSCADTQDTFYVNNDSVEKDCSWLASRIDKDEKDDNALCDFAYVACKCPKTCGVCNIFDQETGLLDLAYF